MDIRSKILDYLLSFLVMEESREACYLSDDLCNIFQEEFWGKLSFIYSGSFVEGLINHGDVDIMHVADDFLVVEHPDNIPESFKETVLLLEPDHCEPGYTRLRIFRDIPGNQFEIYTNEDEKLYLDRIKYLNIKFGKHEMLNVDMHGPALLTFSHVGKGDTDMVECFHCPEWPTFSRRELGLYQNNVKNIKTENITKAGCHVVPVAHPNSSNPDLEFRMSFSVAERCLIENWHKKQIDIYFLCKELFNKFFSSDHDLEKGLCSYFAKTIIYWMNEQYSLEFWTNNSTITILRHFFDLLRVYIANKSCPNYFIPDNLMMSTYTDIQTNSLLTRLDDVCQDIFYSIICCNIFKFADNELLASLYKTITLVGNQSDVSEILTSIYHSDFINGCNKEFLQSGGIKKLNRYKFIHNYYHNFMRFCLGRFLVGVPLHLKQELLKVTKRIDKLHYSSYLMECANMYINRCLAIIAFSAVFHLKDEQIQMKNKLLIDSEKLFLLSMDVPGELSDGAISGGVYLGLFYYLTDQREKSKLILGKTAKSALEYYRIWRKHSLPILLINEKTRLLKCPSYLVNENILRDLFEKWHLHGGIRLDPLFLIFYLIHRITNDALDLFEFVKIENRNCSIEASNYIRYRLGLFAEGSCEFIEYSKEKNCILCSFDQSQQSD